MGSTKILVFRLKEIIYTALFIGLGILLIILLIFMFTNKKDKVTPTFSYVPGVYTSSVVLNDQPINVEVIVDKNHINSVKLMDLNTASETLYPLLQPAMSSIETQLINQTAIQSLEINSDYHYTSLLLLEAVNNALAKAKE